MKKKNKLWMPFMAVGLAVILFAGWGKKPVELLNDNPPLIDLDAAIREADFGKNGNTDQNAGDPSQENPGGNNGDSDHTSQEEGKTHVIKVRDREVTYEGESYGDRLAILKNKLIRAYRSGDFIRLVDDYAEAHTYRNALALVEELEEKGYDISAD